MDNKMEYEQPILEIGIYDKGSIITTSAWEIKPGQDDGFGGIH